MSRKDNPIFEDETYHKPKGSAGYWLALVAVAVGFALAVAFLPGALAHAEDIDTDPEADEFQQEIERTAAEYEQAVEQLDAARASASENADRIAELEEQIPLQQQRSAEAARQQYKLQQGGSGLLELLFAADDFYGFMVSLDYVSRVSQANVDEMNRLSDMKTELDEKQKQLVADRYAAKEHAAEAKAALKEAQEARKEAQRRAQEEARRQAEEAAAAAEQAAREAEEAAKAQAEAEAAQKAEEEAKAAQETAEKEAAEEDASDDQDSESSDGQDEGDGQADSASDGDELADPSGAPLDTPSEDGADWDADEAAFVNEWAGRIDAFLAGSAMAGQGTAFAKAAWTYGVDPRWSPAIANTESSLGANCFLPYNAWGWGSASWSSWEEAIDAHVGGLARGYGYTISIRAAQKYCPPNWENWYNNTLAAMNMI